MEFKKEGVKTMEHEFMINDVPLDKFRQMMPGMDKVKWIKNVPCYWGIIGLPGVKLNIYSDKSADVLDGVEQAA
jgi:hypothetical protein